MNSYLSRALTACLCTVAASVALAPAAAPTTGPVAAAAQAPKPQTRTDLETAMRGEAFAHASYTFYAAQAVREKLASVAARYRRTASVELNDHFTREAALTGPVGSNAANLKAAIDGETYESTTMYPTFARQAKQDGDNNAAALFTHRTTVRAWSECRCRTGSI